MGIDGEVLKACMGIVRQKVRNSKEMRQALVEKCVNSAVTLIRRHNELIDGNDVSTAENYFAGGYQVNYRGESINGSITVMDTEQDPDEGTTKNCVISVNCQAHSCATRSLYNAEIPETDIREFIRFATRGPTLTDRWKRMAGYYEGDF